MPLTAIGISDLGAAPSTSDVILKHLRQAIITGQFDEGEPIRQDEVALLFNVSKIPVREALKRLEAEGLVAFHKNKGAVATAITEPEIVEIFEVRALLESCAIRLSIPRMTKDTFSRAKAYCDEFPVETDVARWSELNWKFHSCLYEDAGRPYLMGLIRSVNDRIERYQRIQLRQSGVRATGDREHRQILRLCMKRDVDGAAELIHLHVMHACSSLLEHLAQKRKIS